MDLSERELIKKVETNLRYLTSKGYFYYELSFALESGEHSAPVRSIDGVVPVDSLCSSCSAEFSLSCSCVCSVGL